jgi:putative restriction endonuclease
VFRGQDLLRPIDALVSALESSGLQVQTQSLPGEKPVLLAISRHGVTRQLRVYIWNVTRGGPGDVRPDDEYRIQKIGDAPLELGEDRLTFLMGWYEPQAVFVAWDPAAHKDASHSASIHIRAQYIEMASSLGMAIQHRDTPDEDVVVVAYDTLPAYLERASVIHSRQFAPSFSTYPELDTVRIEKGEQPPAAAVPTPRDSEPQERQRIVTELGRWSRRTMFRYQVRRAYGYRCAICGIDCGLIESAHIIGVPNPESTDDPSNGLALCPLHHEAYDAGIIGVDENYVIILNEDKITELQGVGRAEGLDLLLSFSRIGQKITLPSHPRYRPNPELLRLGLSLRGFKSPPNRMLSSKC